MKNRRTERFRDAYRILPRRDQRQARRAYKLFVADQSHRSLHFKQVHPDGPTYSIRISKGLRALAKRDGDTLIWFWIGTHAEYDKLLRNL